MIKKKDTNKNLNNSTCNLKLSVEKRIVCIRIKNCLYAQQLSKTEKMRELIFKDEAPE